MDQTTRYEGPLVAQVMANMFTSTHIIHSTVSYCWEKKIRKVEGKNKEQLEKREMYTPRTKINK